jgi:transposase-like protein
MQDGKSGRRKFDKEFKTKAVRLATEGKSLKEDITVSGAISRNGVKARRIGRSRRTYRRA